LTKKLFKQIFVLKESQCTLISEKIEGLKAAIESIKRNRAELESYIQANPKFLCSLAPVSVPEKPLVAKSMALASEKADVGPMAAVAGVIADLAVIDMIKQGCEVAIVEDGGEVSAVSNVQVDMAVVAGEEPLSKRFGFRLMEFPIGIATSSGRFSHALSFGDAEAVTVFCKEAGLADAVATAVGNVIKGEAVKVAIQAGIKKALSIDGVEGVLIIYRGQVGMAGKLPEIIKVL
jgi:uncharacterized protein